MAAPTRGGNKSFLLTLKDMSAGGSRAAGLTATSSVVVPESKGYQLNDFLDATAGMGGAHFRGSAGKQVNHRMHYSQMTSPKGGNKLTNGGAIAWGDGSVISDQPSAIGDQMRVKSMLTKNQHGPSMEYGAMRDGLMTPDHGAHRRQQSRMTQVKIDTLRRKLNS